VADGRKLLVVELSCGQFHDDVFFHLAKGLGRVVNVGLLNRMGGALIAVDDVVARVKEL
jgi:hypothetical protein